MRIRADTTIASVPNRDSWRPGISQILISRTGATAGAAVATNGFIAVAVPVELDEEDVTGCLQADQLAAVLKLAPKDKMKRRSVALRPKFLVAGDSVITRIPEVSGFPIERIAEILNAHCAAAKPKKNQSPFEVLSFNSRLMSQLAGLLGTEAIKVHAPRKNGPVFIEPVNEWGEHQESFLGRSLPWAILMPIHTPEIRRTQ